MPLIQVRGLTKLYRMGDTVVRALDGVDLDIERGEFIAITGASGSGKSTMMHVLGCLDRPTAGHYLLNDREVSELSDRELAAIRNRYVGFVFQTFNLINRTPAIENVGVPLFYARRTNSHAPARQALERVGLEHRVHHKPSELSGGERQRVAIARAIVNDPVLLLADEPTGNLDSRTGRAIMEIFKALNEQGVTIVLVTHEQDVASQARRIVQMRDGRIVSDRSNTPQRLAAREDFETPVPELVPHANEPQPNPQPAAEPVAACSSESDLPRRMAQGATGSLVSGVASVVLLVAAVGAILGIVATGWRPDSTRPMQPPPPEVMTLGFLSMACLFTGFIIGAVAILWSRGVLRRIRSEPGNWIGAGRARTASLCGWVAVLVPVLWVGFQFTLRVMR